MAGRTIASERVDPVIRSPETLEHEAFLRLTVTSVQLIQDVTEVVKAHGLTEPQFNALRILRGAGEDGLPCSRIADRMITRVPDVTRLVDRLERMGLAERHRDLETDRRVVRVTISARGRALLQGLDNPVRAIHQQQFGSLSRAELRELIRLLAEVGARKWTR